MNIQYILPNGAKELVLFKRILQKDSMAFSDLYDLHSKYIYTVIYNVLKNEEEAEDILQEVFLLIWDKMELYDESIGSPLSWMTRITRNKAIDRYRNQGYKKGMEKVELDVIVDYIADSDSENPETVTSMKQEKSKISLAIDKLCHNQKILIQYTYFDGYSQSETAEFLHLPLGTVKTRLRAAMKKLKPLLLNVA